MTLSYLPDLSRATFIELADGFGDARAVSELDAAQCSLNLARLELLRRLVVERFPDHYSDLDFAGAWALLAEAESADSVSARTILEIPAVGAWIAQSLVTSLASEDGSDIRRHLSYAWAVAAAAAVRAKVDFECRVPVHRGLLFLPGIGAYPYPGASGSAAVLRHDALSLRLDGELVAPVGGPQWLVNRELAADHDGLALRVVLDDLDPYRSSGGLNAAARLGDAEVMALRGHLSGAWAMLVERHRSYAEGISAALRSLVLLDGYPANRSVSAAFRDSHGSVGLTMPADATSLAVTLVHETQHLKLNRILERVDLHTGKPDCNFRAPWREDPRPLEGLMHGAYAFAAVTDFWRTEREVASGSMWAKAEYEFARWRGGVSDALLTLLTSGDLTPAGVAFFSRLSERVAPWLDDKVDDEVRTVAEQSILDDEVSWRLRNSQVDVALAEGLARQYMEGCAATDVPQTFPVKVGASPREDHSRQDLVRLGLMDMGRFEQLTSDPAALANEVPAASRADVAYALRNADAGRLYRGLVDANPSNSEAWTGLAVALHREGRSALVEQVELSFAVHHQLRTFGKSAGPEDVAQWLSGGA